MTLPNIITLARILSVPATVYLMITGQYGAAFWLFILAGISDAVDGILARALNMRSELGAHLDPLADKAMLTSIYITLALVTVLPIWLAVLVVSRDVLIIGAVVLSWGMGHRIKMHPLFVSKANTAAQIALAALVLGSLAFGREPALFAAILIGIVAILTILSTIAYLVEWIVEMSDALNNNGPGAKG